MAIISRVVSSIAPCSCGENHKIEAGKRKANLTFYIGGIALLALAGLTLGGVFPKLATNLGVTGAKALGGTLAAAGAIFLIIAASMHRGSCKRLA